MRGSRRFRTLLSVVQIGCLAASCAYSKTSVVPAFASDGKRIELTAADEAARSGTLRLDREGALWYTLREPIAIPAGGAIEAEYEFSAAPGGTALVFAREGEPSWALPPDASFLGIGVDENRTVRYRFPAGAAPLSAFRIEARIPEREGPAAEKDAPKPSFQLRALRVLPRAYGFYRDGRTLFLTPFVYRETVGSRVRFTVDPPPEYRPLGAVSVGLSLGAAAGTAVAGAAEYRYAGAPDGVSSAEAAFASGALPDDPFPFVFESTAPPRSLRVEPDTPPPFPDVPIVADPGIVLAYRLESWRDKRYEVFRWQRFPSILIFDTADYAVQERLFKRLAFFTEKAGFRGRLAADADIADLHGWNAHDYRAEDLAAFFETARITKFPLNAEENELLRALLSSGIVKRESSGGGKYVAGNGALISISRESSDYLRALFMTHEGYHGLFFTDEAFRRFASDRYRELPSEPKEFLKAYFDSRRYDVRDDYLMTNELMAYCLQQPVELAARYFGDTLPVRLEKDLLRKKVLPPRSAGDIPYPALAAPLKAVAAQFDAYVLMRWGMRAGGVSLFYQISRTKAAR